MMNSKQILPAFFIFQFFNNYTISALTSEMEYSND